MLHLISTTAEVADSQQVEAIGIARAAIAMAPDERHAPDGVPFEGADRLDGRPADTRLPRLHLDECDHAAAPGHQVEIVPAEAKTVRLDLPSARSEIGDGRALAGDTSAVAPIGPLADWNEASSGSHGAEDTKTRGPERHRITATADDFPGAGLAPLSEQRLAHSRG
jgi:hypothetical protein